MKIQSKYRGIKGFVTVYNHAVRYRYMITKTALNRYKIIIHWQKHGIESTIDAFSVSRRTLFYWKERMNKGKNRPETLNPKSKAPRQRRKRLWDVRLIEEIKRLRILYLNLGAEKIYPLLLDFADS